MNRPGFALLFVLVVVAALQLLTLSTLALATVAQVRRRPAVGAFV